VGLYPNPSTGEFSLVINCEIAKVKVFNLYNQEGKLIQQKRINTNKGVNMISWNISHLPSGTYVVTDETGAINKNVIRQ
jgi:hypothetical protein